MKSSLTPLVGIENPPLILNRNQPNVFNLRVFSKMPDSINYSWKISCETIKANSSQTNSTVTEINADQTTTGLERKTIKLNAWEIPENVSSVLVYVKI